jgi:hypothetical protein
MTTLPSQVKNLQNLDLAFIRSMMQTIEGCLTNIDHVHTYAVGFTNTSEPNKPMGVAVPTRGPHPYKAEEMKYIIKHYRRAGWGDVSLDRLGDAAITTLRPEFLVFLFEKPAVSVGSMIQELIKKLSEPVTSRPTAWFMTWTETEDGAGRPDGYSLHKTFEHATDARHNANEVGPRSIYSQPDMDPVEVYISNEKARELNETDNSYIRGSGDGSHYQRVDKSG